MPQKVRKEHPMHPVPARVLDVREDMPDCHSLILQPEEKGLAGFQPGQFYMLYVFGHGEVPISVSGNPVEKDRLTFTVMSVGAVTKALCHVNAGDHVGLRGPFGSTWPLGAAKGRDILVIAGGLGLAPLRPVIYHMISHADDYGDIALLYGTRTPETILFHEELQEWNKREDLQVLTTVDSAGPDWDGHVGVVTDLIGKTAFDPARTTALTCGPEIMMRFTANALQDTGVDTQQIYVSMERNMKCALGLCGRCQYGPYFICKDGPVFSFDRVAHLFKVREV